MPDSIVDTVVAFRARLMRREAEALKRVVAAYLHASETITRRIDTLLRNGINENQQIEFDRLVSLQKQIQERLETFGHVAKRDVESAQDEAVDLAEEHAAQLLSSFNRLPVGAIESLIGVFEPASPLTRLFNSLASDMAFAARNILVSGVAQGLSTQAIARQIRDQFGIGLHRATTISRTEILKAYRSSSSQTYKANRDIVKGWLWHAALGKRCCSLCTAMHGTRHSVDEELVSHPSCRCVQIPIIDEEVAIQTGNAWLKEQDEETQVSVLGVAGRKAYLSGAVKLSDFIGEGFHPQFGAIRYQKSLKQILGRDGATKFYKKAA